MRPKSHQLLTLVQGPTVLAAIAGNEQVSEAAVRVTVALVELDANTWRITTGEVANALGITHLTAWAGVREAIAKGWLHYQDTAGWALRVDEPGQRLYDSVARAERARRTAAVQKKRVAVPRAYKKTERWHQARSTKQATKGVKNNS